MVVESSLKRGRGSKVGARISCSSPSKMLMMMIVILVMMMLSGSREVARINCLFPDHDKDDDDKDKGSEVD